MPGTEWTPLHDFYAQDLDHNLTVVERYVESGDPYKIHECAQVFLDPVDNLHLPPESPQCPRTSRSRSTYPARLLCRVRGSPPYRIPVRLKSLNLAMC